MKTTLQRIKEYIDYKGITVSLFEKNVGFSNGAFASQLKNKKTIGLDKLENILKFYTDINVEWLLSGNGDMLKTYQYITDHSIVSEPEQIFGLKSIPLLPLTAFAGKGLGSFNDLKIERKYQIHEFQNADFLISVKGNSMYPKYSSGDILACSLVKDRLFFQWNKPHVIYTESQGILVKRIRKSLINNCIQCVSDNLDYDPFDVPIDDIVDVAIVIGAIRLE